MKVILILLLFGFVSCNDYPGGDGKPDKPTKPTKKTRSQIFKKDSTGVVTDSAHVITK